MNKNDTMHLINDQAKQHLLTIDNNYLFVFIFKTRKEKKITKTTTSIIEKKKHQTSHTIIYSDTLYRHFRDEKIKIKSIIIIYNLSLHYVSSFDPIQTIIDQNSCAFTYLFIS